MGNENGFVGLPRFLTITCASASVAAHRDANLPACASIVGSHPDHGSIPSMRPNTSADTGRRSSTGSIRVRSPASWPSWRAIACRCCYASNVLPAINGVIEAWSLHGWATPLA